MTSYNVCVGVLPGRWLRLRRCTYATGSSSSRRLRWYGSNVRGRHPWPRWHQCPQIRASSTTWVGKSHPWCASEKRRMAPFATSTGASQTVSGCNFNLKDTPPPRRLILGITGIRLKVMTIFNQGTVCHCQCSHTGSHSGPGPGPPAGASESGCSQAY